jgi:hypothetical protein
MTGDGPSTGLGPSKDRLSSDSAAPTDLTGRAIPMPTAESEPFWSGLRAGKLVIQHCEACSSFHHEPIISCPSCTTNTLSWVEVPPVGTVYTFCICELAFGPGLSTPYVPALVQIDDAPGVRLVTNIIDCPPSDVQIGMRVAGRFASDPERALLFFTPIEGGSGLTNTQGSVGGIA